MAQKIVDKSYVTIALNNTRNNGWAVIGTPSGAIASDEDGRLLMKLERSAAESISRDLNGQLARSPGGAFERRSVAVAAPRA